MLVFYKIVGGEKFYFAGFTDFFVTKSLLVDNNPKNAVFFNSIDNLTLQVLKDNDFYPEFANFD